jgi:hypothetical protein
MRKRTVLWAILAIIVVALGVRALRLTRIPPRLPAVPAELTARAVIPGIPGARYFVGMEVEPFVKDVGAAREREKAFLASSGGSADLPPVDLLAVSGGGDNGAFGAGLLNGWTAAGNRPTFKAVTGVSTGALIAPFAFLGPDYDGVLKTVYTSIKPTDIAEKRGFLAAIDDDGMADNRPLWGLLSRFVDEAFLAKVADEHRHGRLLLVGTTDLDARQPVIWNMGAIAASGAPDALELFRSILIASAAIPGAFPPTMVRVEVDGTPYSEMHVDGGCSAQVFLYPPSMLSVARTIGDEMVAARGGRVWVIRNSPLAPTWLAVERRTINIAGLAIASLIHNQGVGDLYRVYVTTQRDGLDFNLAYIGAEFTYPNKKEEFETAYMVKLYDYGFGLARAGYPWKKLPPGIEGAAGKR